jgi:hypothetical protein
MMISVNSHTTDNLIEAIMTSATKFKLTSNRGQHFRNMTINVNPPQD